ncbi:hypothetical protein GCM10022403_096790 [Streptomyces coacervatus]|uniref:Uncharacterized protein n=1 Tax=Streptomyces coacervatus TaxID=647381 RepID=A0ABP7JQ62_9ACTN|nr:hypothetical protein [Streptomyces coacervatus]MDF2264067.1 hypothetical protein [Streptomyces coacervatus]
MAPRPLPQLPQYDTDAVTRLLCAHAHLDENFALDALDEFTGDRLKAVGLPLGINLVALVRHAAAAQLRRRRRDRLLTVLLVAMVAAVPGGVLALVQGQRSAAVALGALLVGAGVVAAGVVHRTEHSAWVAARTVFRDPGKPLSQAPPLDRATEDRLTSLRQMNVVPYDASVEARNPFVGSGIKIRESVWAPIDVGTAAAGKTIKPFDAVALHGFLAREMTTITGLTELRARNRLYIRGLHVSHVGRQLLPDPLKAPNSRIDKQLVQAGANQAGAAMATYLSLEMVGRGGRYVVSVHLRARLLQTRLSWEVAAYVLPPLQEEFSRVAALPLGGFEEWWLLVRITLANWRVLLTGAPGRIRHRRVRRVRHARALEKDRRDISKYHVVYDYGAFDSLRERVSGITMAYNEVMDATDAFQRIHESVMIATERFLRAHNVDTAALDKVRTVINNQNNFAGPTWGNFGNDGKFVMNQYQASPAGGGQGSPGQQGQQPQQPANPHT